MSNLYFINKWSETNIIKLLECLIDSVFVIFDAHVFQDNGFQLPSGLVTSRPTIQIISCRWSFRDYVDGIYHIETFNNGHHIYSKICFIHLQIYSKGLLRRQWNLTRQIMTIFSLWNFHLLVATFQQHM